jgi:hypothetical protein
LQAVGAVVTAGQSQSAGFIYVGNLPGSTGATSYAQQFETTIIGYAQTTFFKTLASKCGGADSAVSGHGIVLHTNGTWASTAAINSVKIAINATGNFTTGTVFTLWGRT